MFIESKQSFYDLISQQFDLELESSQSLLDLEIDREDFITFLYESNIENIDNESISAISENKPLYELYSMLFDN